MKKISLWFVESGEDIGTFENEEVEEVLWSNFKMELEEVEKLMENEKCILKYEDGTEVYCQKIK